MERLLQAEWDYLPVSSELDFLSAARLPEYSWIPTGSQPPADSSGTPEGSSPVTFSIMPVGSFLVGPVGTSMRSFFVLFSSTLERSSSRFTHVPLGSFLIFSPWLWHLSKLLHQRLQWQYMLSNECISDLGEARFSHVCSFLRYSASVLIAYICYYFLL